MPSKHPLGYFGSINYDEPNQSSYKSIKVYDNHVLVREFNLGCPVLDHVNLMMWLGEEESGIRWSSSYDHFFMDGDIYTEDYVTFNGSENPDDWVFVDTKEKIWADEYDFRVINRGFKSFQELRQYVKASK